MPTNEKDIIKELQQLQAESDARAASFSSPSWFIKPILVTGAVWTVAALLWVVAPKFLGH